MIVSCPTCQGIKAMTGSIHAPMVVRWCNCSPYRANTCQCLKLRAELADANEGWAKARATNNDYNRRLAAETEITARLRADLAAMTERAEDAEAYINEAREAIKLRKAAVALLSESQAMLKRMSAALGSDEITVPYEGDLRGRINALLKARKP